MKWISALIVLSINVGLLIEEELHDGLMASIYSSLESVAIPSRDTPPHLEGPALNTSGSRLDQTQSGLEDGVGNSKGTRDRSVTLEDDDSDTPDPEAAAVSVSVDAGADPASELSKGAWYDVEDECYEKSSSAPAPGSLRPRRPSAEPPHPQTDEEHDRGGISCGRSEELGRGPPLHSHDRGPQEQQQRQEVAAELMRGDDGGDGEEPEERGEKRRHPDETEIGSDIHYPEALTPKS